MRPSPAGHGSISKSHHRNEARSGEFTYGNDTFGIAGVGDADGAKLLDRIEVSLSTSESKVSRRSDTTIPADTQRSASVQTSD